MPAPSTTLTTGLNSYYLIELIENLSQLAIGYDDDVDDINQDLVLQFIKEGYQRIISLDGRWPWFQATYNFNALLDTRAYSTGITLITAWSNPTGSTAAGYYPQVSPAATAFNKTTADIKEIISLTNNTNAGNELIYIDQAKAESIWVGTNDVTGIPSYWSLWGNQINLWPKPDQTYNITIRGYRQANLTWLTDSNNSTSTSYVDMDNEMSMLLINFTLSRIFQFQEDPEMANVYMKHFETGAAIIKSNLTAPNSNQPLIMSGGLQLNPYGYWWSDTPGIQVMPGSPTPSAIGW